MFRSKFQITQRLYLTCQPKKDIVLISSSDTEVKDSVKGLSNLMLNLTNEVINRRGFRTCHNVVTAVR